MIAAVVKKAVAVLTLVAVNVSHAAVINVVINVIMDMAMDMVMGMDTVMDLVDSEDVLGFGSF